jgi:hypothetical protein
MGHTVRRAAPRVLGWVAGWLFSAALYLLLIDITSLPELIVGAGAATLAATGFELARERHLAGERIRLHWLRHAHRAVIKVPSDIARVALAAIRQLARRDRTVGEFRAVRFRSDRDDALAAGRAALSESFGSFAPNTIVIGIDRRRGLIIAHQLSRTGGPEAIDVLELGER